MLCIQYNAPDKKKKDKLQSLLRILKLNMMKVLFSLVSVGIPRRHFFECLRGLGPLNFKMNLY